MPLFRTQGVVLRARDLGEHDRLVTLYTRDLGKLTAVAKGARRVRSRFGGALELFTWGDATGFEREGRDLLRLDQKPPEAAEFTPDAIVGFDTNRSQLWMSGTLREDYERAAEAVASRIADDPDALARLIPADAPADLTARARVFIESFGLRAYRRPLSSEEVSQYLTLFEQGPELAPERVNDRGDHPELDLAPGQHADGVQPIDARRVGGHGVILSQTP